MTLAGAPPSRRILVAALVALVDVGLLVAVFSAVNRVIGDVSGPGEVLLRSALVVAVIAVAAPLAWWAPRPGATWHLVISAVAAIGLVVLARRFDGPVPDGAEDVYAIPIALGVALLAAGSIAASIGVRRAADPVARARRPHHWR